MKVLLLALALLFTGAHGKYFWQKDKPHEEHNLWKVLENSIAIATDALKNLEYSEIAEKFKLNEKLDAAKGNAKHIEKVFEDYVEEIWKSYDAKLHQDLPIFREKIFPLLKEFDNNLEEVFKKALKEAWPVTTDLFTGVGGEFKKFWENFADVAEKSRDRLRTEIDNLRAKVQPHADDIKAEYEKYKGSMAANLGDKAKILKEELDKDLELLHEKLKPYLEELKKHIPHAEDLRKELNELIRDIHEFFTSEKNH